MGAKKLRLLLASSLLALGCVWLLPSAVFAADTVFSQKILPLDCVFTTINAGTGELFYVTPQACGVILPRTNPAAYYAAPQAGSGYVAYSPDKTVFYAPGPSTPNDNSTPATGGLSDWRPIASTPSAQKVSGNNKIVVRVSAVVITGIVFFVALIALIA